MGRGEIRPDSDPRVPANAGPAAAAIDHHPISRGDADA